MEKCERKFYVINIFSLLDTRIFQTFSRTYLMEAKVTLYAVGSEKHFPVASQY